jgi:Sortase domain
MSSRWLAAVGLVGSVGLAAVTVAVWAAWTEPAAVSLARVAAVTAPPTPDRLSPCRAAHPLEATRLAAPSAPDRLSPLRAARLLEATRLAAPAAPIRVEVPAVGLDAAVLAEPLGPGGSLLIPPPRWVGWYDAGPAPGQPGSTVLAGHIDYDGVTGAFVSLASVPDGAIVRITAGSAMFTYRVTQRLLIPKRSLASASLLSSSGPSRLVLVSCGGAFLAARHAYADNVVIVAAPTLPPASVPITTTASVPRS